jgi:ABC-type glycerol-3-phosphate transport system permease component
MPRVKAHLGLFASYGLILLFCFLFALPVLSMLGTSLKTSSDALSTVSLFPSPEKTYFGNFAQVMRDASFERNLWNSFIVSIASTFASVAVASLAGYAVSRFKGWAFTAFIVLLLLLQMLPSMLVMVPIFLIYKGLNINNTLFGLIVCYATSSLAFCIWMLKGFFDSVPFEVEESAMIDGCSQFSSFLRIILPVSTPGLATVAIFSFVRAWNEYVMARILIQSDELKTINLGLQKFVQEFQVDWSLLSAGAVIATVPTILFLLFAQKYLVQGLTSGAIKG